jgi:hypothetical protein
MSTTLQPTPRPTAQPKKRRSRPNAFADFVRLWESLLSAVADHATVLAPVEAHRAALAETLEKLKQVKGFQQSRATARQTATQTLKEAVREAKDRAIRLREAIRAELGPTTEQLTQFGIRPLRRR